MPSNRVEGMGAEELGLTGADVGNGKQGGYSSSSRSRGDQLTYCLTGEPTLRNIGDGPECFDARISAQRICAVGDGKAAEPIS